MDARREYLDTLISLLTVAAHHLDSGGSVSNLDERIAADLDALLPNLPSVETLPVLVASFTLSRHLLEELATASGKSRTALVRQVALALNPKSGCQAP
ncbi:hypothetical protein [Spirillospora sp. CA-128828]|uniref:hypothetical protein n=1 Tax=Spirillospora sp. CA-128828 TaxID=3240033 RepID=UPI003D8CE4AC